MYKLISASFFKLRKSLCFKIYLLFGLVYGVSNVVLHYLDVEMIKIAVSVGEVTADGYTMNADSVLFDSAMTMLFAAAVFTAIFLGREHSDGTIRNKLIVGHGRSAVYLTNLIVCVAANTAGLLLALCTTLAVGVPLLGTDFTAGEIAVRTVCIVTASIAVTALTVTGAMLIHSRAAITAVLILSVFAFLFAATYIEERLNTPEYYSDYEMITDENGETRIEKTGRKKIPIMYREHKGRYWSFWMRQCPCLSYTVWRHTVILHCRRFP